MQTAPYASRAIGARTLFSAAVLFALLLSGMPAGAGRGSVGEPEDPAVHGTGQRIGANVAQRLREAGISEGMTVALIATLPIVELRGAIPVGNNAMGMRNRWWVTYAWAVFGNLVPVPFILLLLGPVSQFCMRWRIGRRFFEWLFARTRRKAAGVERYETVGLTLFVAIPLPVTGAWTGAMAAFLMGLRFRYALSAIAGGVLIAGIIVTILSLLGWIGAAIAAIVLCGLAATTIQRMLR